MKTADEITKVKKGMKEPFEKNLKGAKFNPVREVKQIKKHKKDPGYVNRLLTATPTLGTVRMEWVSARYGQIIPVNWSMVHMNQFVNPFIPIDYTVADAQNIIVKAFIEGDFEWLFLIEDDNVIPPDTFVRLNEYMLEGKVPVVSGLYYTKSSPSEPLAFRGRGNGYFSDFKLGEKVWVDGVPTGCLLIHRSILDVMWNDAEEYRAGDTITKRVFIDVRKSWFDVETAQVNQTQGTSDLDWCTRVIEDKVFERAGWGSIQKKKYPFLIDTNIFVRHIDKSGRMYPV